MSILTLRSISFAFDDSDKIIIDHLNASFSHGWTGLIGPNGCGKSTLLQILAGRLRVTSGEMQGIPELIHLCEQETLRPPATLESFRNSDDKSAIRTKSALSLHELLMKEWEQMSCGEQKRWQLGCSLWQSPDLLLIDEPTNHLDQKNRDVILDALGSYRGTGIVVSHDRDLLQKLCQKFIFFVGSHTYEMSGSYDEARNNLAEHFAYNEKQRENSFKKAASLRKEVSRIRQLTESSKKRLSKGHLNRKDHDSKAKIDGARLSGKDASLGKKKGALENRIKKIEQSTHDLAVVKDYSGSVFFDIPASYTKVLLHQTNVRISLPDASVLSATELLLKSGEKIGITGFNGTGKSSLIEHCLKESWIKSENYLYLRQELNTDEIDVIRKKLNFLSKEEYSRCLQIIARLGSDPKQVFKSHRWSAGEIRKIAIAIAIVTEAELLILDEPGNHLDILSVERLEDALKKSNLTLLVISHDSRFIRSVCSIFWNIQKDQNGNSILKQTD
ncbi:MAG: ABC-F family ATP-binding cassette domain-containing protein [Deltaproteobacteria bacterium]|nr:ABC-F family ATP-binding cassette domain-containing protein [Deltaproteobacteria bacterium]